MLSFMPELGEAASGVLIVSHSAGNIWSVFWTKADAKLAEAELKRLKIKPQKQFDTTSDEYKNPWDGEVLEFTIARLTTKQVEKLEGSPISRLHLLLD